MQPDLGVLFIHGIGQQAKGDTLLSFGESLDGWLRRWFKESERPIKVVVNRMQLEGEQPAHGEWILGTEPERRWLMAECLWADVIRTPDFKSLLLWSAQIAPGLLIFHHLQRIRFALSRQRPKGLLPLILTLVPPLVSTYIAFLLLPLLLLLLMASLMLSLVPVPVLQEASGWIRQTVSSVLGDSYVLVQSPMQEAALLSRLLWHLRWLREQGCQTICVVAHSQGAALAARCRTVHPEAFTQTPIFSFGSGASKLAFVQWFLECRSASTLLAWAALPALLLSMVIPYNLIRIFQEFPVIPGEALWVLSLRALFYFIFGIGFTGLIFIMAVGVLLRIALKSMDKAPDFRVRLREIDREYWASADMVPSIEMNESHQMVTNFNSALLDHTSYWQNLDEFVGSLVFELARWSKMPLPGAAEANKRAAVQRALRVRWLSRVRVFAIALTVPNLLGVRLPSIPSPRLEATALATLMGFLGEKNSLHLKAPAIATVFQVLPGLALILCGYIALVQAWKWWEKEDFKNYFSRTPYRTLHAGNLCSWFLLGLFIELLCLHSLRWLAPWPSGTALGSSLFFYILIFDMTTEKNTPANRSLVVSTLWGVSLLLLLPVHCILFSRMHLSWIFGLSAIISNMVCWVLLCGLFFRFKTRFLRLTGVSRT
jgi:hypothetical protein